MSRRRKNKFKLKSPFKYLFVFVAVIFFYCIFMGKNIGDFIDISKIKMINPLSDIRKEKKRYNECLKLELNEENFDEATKNKKEEIISYAKNNGLRYAYEDLNYNYIITYNENDPVYGASLIKLVTAIYLIDNDVDLNQTKKYTPNFVAGSSDGMKKHKIGENVSLETLMKYSITYSDNSAHHMLISFIGKDKLKEYAKGLGATSIFTGAGDDYGNQTTHDTLIYLKRAYELINGKENGKLLKEYMLNNKKNNLNISDDFQIAHKYGSYNTYFHDIGISFNKHPYTISVLTTKGDPNGGKYINNLSRLTKEFNDLYYDNQDNYCKEYSKLKD